MPHATEPAIRRRLDAHARRFDGLIARAEAAMAAGRADDAVGLAQRAAVVAWQFHAACFASPRLEALLLELGQGMPAPEGAPRAPTQGASPQRVLHVLTQAAPVGGHTKLAWRWIRHDEGRVHGVALTDQGPLEVPAWLEEAAMASGGALQRVDREALTPRERATVLRRLAAGYDLVVLHAHPHDVVPLLAFATSDRPPVILMNHADHVFWLGVSIADQVACIRQRAIELCINRRGLPPERCALLPIPVDPVPRTLERAEARRQLGLPEDAVILLTVATAYKFNPLLEGPDFVETLLPVIQAHPAAMALAIGPPDRGAWRRARLATGGRLRALGERRDLSLFYQAADIYLESMPLGSFTALLEAGSHGLPLLSHLWLPGAARQMASDNPGIEQSHLQPTTTASYRDTLGRLIADPAAREALGLRTQAEIRARHAPHAWKASLEALYRQAMAGPQAVPLMPRDVPTELTEHDVYLEYLHRQQKIQMVLDAVRHPSREQFQLWWNRLRMYR